MKLDQIFLKTEKKIYLSDIKDTILKLKQIRFNRKIWRWEKSSREKNEKKKKTGEERWENLEARSEDPIRKESREEMERAWYAKLSQENFPQPTDMS